MSTAGITTIGIPQDIKQRAVITISQDGDEQTGAKGYMPFAGDVVAISFINDSGDAYDGATGAKIKTGAGATIKESTNDLANHVSERLTSLANNTGFAKAAVLALTTGASSGVGGGPTIAVVEIEGKYSDVV